MKRDKSMRHIVAGALRGVLAYRLCAGVLVGRPLRGLPFPHRRFAALCSRRALRALDVVLWLHCCKNVTPAARTFASRFALRLCAAARRLARAVALALLARRCAARVVSHRAALLRCPPCPLRGQWVVRRCCGALLPRSAGRGRRCGAVAPLVPAARGVARSRRCCGSPAGSVPGIYVRAWSPRPCPASTSVLASLCPCQASTSVPGRPHLHLHRVGVPINLVCR